MVAQIRAVLPIQSLRVLEQLLGPEHSEVLRRIAPATLADIRGAARRDWLPLAHDLELSAAVVASFGPEVDRARARANIFANLETPLLRPFLAGAEMLFGRVPAAMLAAVPRGWPVLYNDAGSMRYEIVGGLERHLIYERVPPALLAQPDYLEAIAGALESLFDACKIEGEVRIASVEAARREVVFACTWE